MKTFNIRDFGARVCDTPQTEAIQATIDACFLAGGGRVVIPCGVFITGGFRLRSNIELYLETGAIVRGIRDPEQYSAFLDDKIEPILQEDIDAAKSGLRPSANPISRWSNGLIKAIDAKNISVTGEPGSYFDGCYCFDPQGEQNYRGPHGMSFWRCENIRLSGYTFIHSSNWCHIICKSKNITVENVTIHGGCDGVNIHCCDNVLIENCNINSGDDCVAGFNTHDVIVRNCTLNTPCMSVRMGGNNILIENCVSDERNFGTRRWLADEKKMRGEVTDENCNHRAHTAFSYYCDYRWGELRKPAENITIRNCRFDQEDELIRVEYDGRHRFCQNRGLRSLYVENCSFADIIYTGMIWGKDIEKITCHFKNVHVVCKEGYEDVPLLAVGNFEKLVFENCTFEGYTDPTILVGTDDEDKIEIINSPSTVKKVSREEALAAHPQGVSSADFGNEANLNYY